LVSGVWHRIEPRKQQSSRQARAGNTAPDFQSHQLISRSNAMKRATEKMRLPREADRRVKITEDKRFQILNHKGVLSQRVTAKKFGVSRRMVTFIWFPERLIRANKLYKERRKDGRYYNKETWAATMRKHRAHKAAVLEK